MADRNIDLKISADLKSLKASLKQAESSIQNLGKKFDKTGGRGLNDLRRSSDSLRGSLNKMGTAASGATTSTARLAKAGKPLGKSFADARLAIAGATIAIAGIGAALAGSVRSFSSFTTRMAEVNTLIGLPKEGIASLSKEVRALAVELGLSAEDSAAALYEIISAGTDVGDSMFVLRESSKAAIAGLTDVKTAADLGTSVMNAYGYSAEKLPDIFDTIFQTIKGGKTTFPELAAGLGKAMPLAVAAKVPFDELSATLAALTVAGIKTPEAIVATTAAIQSLAAPKSEEARKLMKKWGIEWRGLSQTLEDISKKNLSFQDISKLIPEKRAVIAISSLTGRIEGLNKQVGLMKERAGSAKEAYDIINDTPEQRMRKFQSAIRELGFELSGLVIKATPMITALTTFAVALINMSDEAKLAVLALGGLAIAATIAPMFLSLTRAMVAFTGVALTVSIATGTLSLSLMGLIQSLKVAGGLLLVFGVGFSLGKIIWEFDAVKKFAIRSMSRIHLAWLHVKKGLFSTDEKKIKAINDQMEKIRKFSREAILDIDDPERGKKKPKKKTETTIKKIDVQETATRQAGLSEEEEKERKRILKARISAAREIARAELKSFKEGIKNQERDLEQSYKDRLISSKDYFAEKAQLEQVVVSKEIVARHKEIGRIDSDDDAKNEIANAAKIKSIYSEIATLTEKRGRIASDAARSAADAEKDYQAALQGVRDELQAIQGLSTQDQRERAVRDSMQGILSQAQAEGDTEGAASIEKLITVKTASADLDALEADFNAMFDRLDVATQEVQNRIDQGVISQGAGWREINLLQEGSIEKTSALIPEMERLAQVVGEDAVLGVRKMKNEIGGLQTQVAALPPNILQIKNAFEGALAQTLVDPLKNGLQGLVKSFADAMKQMVAKAIAAKLTDKLFGGGSKGGAGGAGGLLSGLLGAFKGGASGRGGLSSLFGQASGMMGAANPGAGAASSLFGGLFGRAQGGKISGAGTSTSDSIPAMLSNGEYVIRSSAVKAWGENFLDFINRGGVPHFATGGSVGNIAALAQSIDTPSTNVNATTNLSIINNQDPKFVKDFLESPDGRKAIVNEMQVNKRDIKLVLDS